MAGLCGASRRRWPRTTRPRAGARRAPDLVRRHFSADATNVLWVADATYVPTGEGVLYLAVVLDVYSRRIVGWAMSHHLHAELMLRALDMALQQRCHDGVILHSDSNSLSHAREFHNLPGNHFELRLYTVVYALAICAEKRKTCVQRRAKRCGPCTQRVRDGT